MNPKIITSKEAAYLIKDGAWLCSQGMGGNDLAEELMLEL